MSARALASVVVTLAVAAGPSSAVAARQHASTALPKGAIVVTFSGTGSGSYRFHQPAGVTAGACRTPDTTYAETDAYHWSYRFVLPPTGGSNDTPTILAAGGLLGASTQTQACGGAPALSGTCTEALRGPLATSSTDLAYPGVIVATAGRLITVGAVGELVAGSPPTCSGVGTLSLNPIQGYSQLQASVSIPARRSPPAAT